MHAGSSMGCSGLWCTLGVGGTAAVDLGAPQAGAVGITSRVPWRPAVWAAADVGTMVAVSVGWSMLECTLGADSMGCSCGLSWCGLRRIIYGRCRLTCMLRIELSSRSGNGQQVVLDSISRQTCSCSMSFCSEPHMLFSSSLESSALLSMPPCN
jgi:hypothetical protein